MNSCRVLQCDYFTLTYFAFDQMLQMDATTTNIAECYNAAKRHEHKASQSIVVLYTFIAFAAIASAYCRIGGGQFTR